jgi:hypothetical protein
MITDQVKKYKHLLEICHLPVYLSLIVDNRARQTGRDCHA